MSHLWPIEEGRDCVVPAVSRTAVVPLFGHRPSFGDPPMFDLLDPHDVDVFQFDFSLVAFRNDRIISAIITAEPALTVGGVIITGNRIQAFVGPATTEQTYDLTAGVTFQSGRVLDWGVEVSVQSF